ncbi:MAG: ribonuclease P protein component [Rhodocyclaceae bacterium]|jgi:ribonuclease P protein component|nr:ribonuclease P protein component [Rhodocyclaceae bacterium]MCL4680417.1 ribonuclease P protein component [Rhodocyclaceae bacterium]
MVFLSACARAAAVQLFVPVGPRDAADSAFDVPTAVVDLGFRGEHRLRKTDEFSSVFAFRRALRGKYFELLYRPNAAVSARLGVVIAKKFVRSAVNRNQIRRIVRESFRLSRGGLPQRDIVVRLAIRLDAPDRRALRSDIDGLFARLSQ